MAKPAIVLVHGFWGNAGHWGKVILELSKLGYEDINAVDNPLTSLEDDVARTTKMLAQIKGPVILAGHSYGGAVISEAGNAPNVAALVYVAAFAPDAGESIGSLGAAFPPTPGLSKAAPDSDNYLWLRPPAAFGENFCQDLPKDEQLVMAITQKAPQLAAAGGNVSTPAWKTKPSFYQISSEDRMIDPANQKRMAERINPKKTITLTAGHASLASQPREVAQLIDDAATAVS